MWSEKTDVPSIPFLCIFILVVVFITGDFVRAGEGEDAGQGSREASKSQGKRSFSSPTLAVVNVREVLSHCSRWKDAREKIEQRQKKAQSTLEKLERRLRTLKIDFDNLPSGTEKKSAKGNELQEALKEYRKKSQEFEKQINQQRNKELSRILDQVHSIVAQYARKNGIDVVLKAGRVNLKEGKNPQTTQAVLQQAATADVLYAHERYDISAEIIERMNAQQAEPISDPPTR